MAKKKDLRYIGPYYERGLVYMGQLFRPKEMTPEEIEDFIEIHPPAADWWEEKESTSPKATEKE